MNTEKTENQIYRADDGGNIVDLYRGDEIIARIHRENDQVVFNQKHHDDGLIPWMLENGYNKELRLDGVTVKDGMVMGKVSVDEASKVFAICTTEAWCEMSDMQGEKAAASAAIANIEWDY